MSSPAPSNPKMSSDSDRTDLGLDELSGLDVVSYQRRWDEIYHKTIRQIQQIKGSYMVHNHLITSTRRRSLPREYWY